MNQWSAMLNRPLVPEWNQMFEVLNKIPGKTVSVSEAECNIYHVLIFYV